jgi:hypothetical protein
MNLLPFTDVVWTNVEEFELEGEGHVMKFTLQATAPDGRRLLAKFYGTELFADKPGFELSALGALAAKCAENLT